MQRMLTLSSSLRASTAMSTLAIRVQAESMVAGWHDLLVTQCPKPELALCHGQMQRNIVQQVNLLVG